MTSPVHHKDPMTTDVTTIGLLQGSGGRAIDPRRPLDSTDRVKRPEGAADRVKRERVQEGKARIIMIIERRTYRPRCARRESKHQGIWRSLATTYI